MAGKWTNDKTSVILIKLFAEYNKQRIFASAFAAHGCFDKQVRQG